jgi:hypothetical protein
MHLPRKVTPRRVRILGMISDLNYPLSGIHLHLYISSRRKNVYEILLHI